MSEVRRGADHLVAALVRAGVSHVYSLSGNQIMPIYDALLDTGIEIVHTRHEAAAVFMAEAYAQLTGTVGVALVTAAPGAGNAMGALFSVRQSETPVLLVSGDAPHGMEGRGAFQELDQTRMSAPLTKRTHRTSSASRLHADTEECLRIASTGRPGPVHLIVPFDVVQDRAEAVIDAGDHLFDGGDARNADNVLEFLAAARRPIILCGPALARAAHGPLLDRLRQASGMPVIAMESPRGARDPSLGALRDVLIGADRIVSLGKRVDFTLSLGKAAPDAEWMQIDADDAERERARQNLGAALVATHRADPIRLAEVVAGRPPSSPHAEWREEVGRLLTRRVSRSGNGDALEPDAVVGEVQSMIERAGESVVICDGGEFGQWAQAGTRGTYRIINGPSGAIGGSIPYAIAARKARPDASVFALLGDGTVGFHMAEFETAVRARTPFVAIVGNDRAWNAEVEIQAREYGPDRVHACELSEARYDLACAALGGHGEHVTELKALPAALERAVASGLPACVDVRIVGRPAPEVSA